VKILIIVGQPVAHVSMIFKRHSSDDPRRYNVPKIGEIAVVFSGEDGMPPIKRDFQVFPKSEHRTSTLSFLSEHVDPMTYPLLFLHGQPGWRPGMLHEESHRLIKNF
jgi:hypothetical protein